MGINDEDCLCSKCGMIREDILMRVDLGQVGYESVLDGAFVKFNVCSECLTKFHNTTRLKYLVDFHLRDYKEYDNFIYDLVKSFPLEYQEPILNSGSNTYLSSEDWIRYEKGEMSDIEKIEMGLSI